MNVVFLSPHFPPDFWRYCAALRDAGATVLGIADVSQQDLRPELRRALTDYYRVDDLHAYGSLVRALGHFTHRHGRLDRIDSLNEYWLETEAALRSDFNIPGIRVEDIDRIKRKSRMKRLFKRAGIRVAAGRVCRTPEQARAFVREVGYPIVAKPDVGVGAARTYRIGDDSDLHAYLADKPPTEYLLEELIPGRIVTFDGLADRDGNVVLETTLVYGTGVMESVNLGVDIHYYVARGVPEDLAEAGRAVARAFGVRERPFHFEFFRLDDGSLVALEVNMRPAGGMTTDMVNYANDMDFHRAWARLVVHGKFDEVPSHRYHCVYVGRKAHRRYAMPHEAVLAEFAPMIVHHQRMEDVFAAAMGSYGYLLRDPDLDPILGAAAAIQRAA